MKRLALSSLSALTLTTACGPAALDFSAVSFLISVDDASATVDGVFERDAACTGNADALEATINGGAATLRLDDDYGGGGGLPPSLFSQGCLLFAQRTFDVDGSGTPTDVVFSVADGADTIEATAPGAIRALAVEPAAVTDPVRTGSTLTFTIDPPVDPAFTPFVLIDLAGGGSAPADATFTGDSISVVVPSLDPGPATLRIILGTTGDCVYEGGDCRMDVELRTTRALTLTN